MQNALTIATILLSALLPQAFADEVVSVGAPVILNENGISVQSIKVGDKVSIQSTLQNNNQTEQVFVYIVQVQDSAGYAVFISWMTGVLSQDSQTPRVSWQPENEGTYNIQVFVWTSVDLPVPLSFAVQTSVLDVRAQVAAECSGSATCFIGTVTRITDGDTLRVDGIAIRLTLVNTPERGDAGYSEATAFTSALCPVGSTALVDEDDGQTGGSFGRMVAKVYCGGNMLNEELLRAGHAGLFTQFCNISEFRSEDWAIRYGC